MKAIYLGALLPLYLLMYAEFVFAQGGGSPPSFSYNELINVKSIPTAPNASSLGKFGDIPVDYSRGIPEITIPLHEVRSRSLSLPISLSYHAGGIKVDEQASWVGAGWALVAGGGITRVMKDRPDLFLQSNNSFKKQLSTAWQSSSTQSYYDYAALIKQKQELNSTGFDLEADILMVNCPGYNGKLFWDEEAGVFIARPSLPVKVEAIRLVNPVTQLQELVGFKLIDVSGIQYTFGIYNGVKAIDQTTVDGDFYITTWHMQEMLDTKTGDKIVFEYYPNESIRTTSPSFSVSVLNPVGSMNYNPITDRLEGVEMSYPIVINSEAKLKKIISFDETVEFIALTNRTDLLPAPQQGILKRLDRIEIRNLSNPVDVIKSYDFAFDYYTIPFNNNYCFGMPYGSFPTGKLRLLSVKEYNKNRTESKPAYTFEYNSSEMLQQFSANQDHWGFAKTAEGTGLIPAVVEGSGLNHLFTSPNGAPLPISTIAPNRESNFAEGVKGLLTKIIYPTGGSTELVYEPNEYSRVIDGSGYISETNKICGGIRVNEIKDFAANQSTPHHTRRFYYRLPTNPTISSGVLANTIMYDTQVLEQRCQGHAYFLTAPPFQVVECAGGGGPLAYTRLNRIVRTSSPKGPIGSTPGGHILYEFVEVVHNSNGIGGKTQYRFNLNGDNPNMPTNSYTRFGRFDGLYTGKLLEQNEFDTQGTLRKTTLNEYSGVTGSGDEIHSNISLIRLWAPTMIGIDLLNHGKQAVAPASYNVITFYPVLIKTTEKIYSQTTPNEFLVNVTEYSYDNGVHCQPSKILTTQSNGEQSSTRIKYVGDYLPTSNSAVNTLQQNNAVAQLVEKQYFTGTGPNDKFLRGEVYEPMLLAGNYVNTGNVFVCDLATPKTLTNVASVPPVPDPNIVYQQVDALNRYTQVVPDTRFYKKFGAYLSYTNYARPAEFAIRDVSSEKILWDYNGKWITCQVKSGLAIPAYAYSSFETTESGGWSYAGSTQNTDYKTGRKCYSLTGGNISKTNLPVGKYVLSYWAKGATQPSVAGGTTVLTKVAQGSATSGTWYQVVKTINVTSANTTLTISGTGLVDELRLHPLDAKMTTYTYEPSLGVTTITDEKGQTRYFEYDAFGRLKAVRDEAGNLLSTQEYKYKN